MIIVKETHSKPYSRIMTFRRKPRDLLRTLGGLRVVGFRGLEFRGLGLGVSDSGSQLPLRASLGKPCWILQPRRTHHET